MLPLEYEFFCKLQKVEGCSYLNTQDCPGTCNLAELTELIHDIDLDFEDVLGEKYES